MDELSQNKRETHLSSSWEFSRWPNEYRSVSFFTLLMCSSSWHDEDELPGTRAVLHFLYCRSQRKLERKGCTPECPTDRPTFFRLAVSAARPWPFFPSDGFKSFSSQKERGCFHTFEWSISWRNHKFDLEKIRRLDEESFSDIFI